jgi:hypothetical protein
MSEVEIDFSSYKVCKIDKKMKHNKIEFIYFLKKSNSISLKIERPILKMIFLICCSSLAD